MSRGAAQGWSSSSGSTARSRPLSHSHGRLHAPALGSGSRKQTGRAGWQHPVPRAVQKLPPQEQPDAALGK